MYAVPWKSAIWRDPGADFDFLRVYIKYIEKVDFLKIVGMGLPGGGNVPTSGGSSFKLSRASQLPYMQKTEKENG